MNSIKNAKNTLLILLLMVLGIGCDDDLNPQTEPVKDISGSWKIVSVFRNDVDITDAMDFNKFQLNFNTDHTYNFENYLPFIVKDPGTWELDDPNYPFKLSFREASGAADVQTNLTYPVISGRRKIRISFSPGCSSNKYEYVLDRVEQ